MRQPARLLLRLAIVLALIACFVLTATAQQVVLSRSVVGSGAAAMTGGTIALAGTAGQTIIGRNTSAALLGEWGFWHTLRPGGVTGIAELTRSASGVAMQVVPNPAASLARLELTLVRAGWVSVRLVDLMGREVASIAGRRLESGAHGIEIPLGSLSSASYIVEVLYDDVRMATVLVVVR